MKKEILLIDSELFDEIFASVNKVVDTWDNDGEEHLYHLKGTVGIDRLRVARNLLACVLWGRNQERWKKELENER